MSELKLLWEIQQLDLEKAVMEKQLRGLPAVREMRKMKPDIEAGQENLKQLKETYSARKKALKQKEDEAAALREKIEDLNKELYSGEHNNPKELAAVTVKLEGLKETLGALDDATIEIMDDTERQKAAILEATAELKVKQDSYRLLLDEYKKQKEKINAGIEQMPARRERLTKGVTDEKFTLYRKMSEKYPQGGVIASAVNGICGGCHMGVSFDVIRHLKNADEVIYCDHCGRILVSTEQQ